MNRTSKRRGTSYRGEVSRRRILRELAKLEESGGPPPTWSELAEAVGIGETTVRFHGRLLREAGLVTFRRRAFRTLRLTDAGRDYARQIQAPAIPPP